MPPSPNLVGQTFGRLTVIARAEKTAHMRCVHWRCTCSCGGEARVSTARLRNGQSTSCGCKRVEKLNRYSYKHGLCYTREYHAWQHMKDRCHNPSSRSYHNYGGRGITVCKRWRDSFENFLEDMGPCPEGYSIDRIDNDKRYSPGNCQWATAFQQQRNKRNNAIVYLHNKKMILQDIVRICGVGHGSVHWHYTQEKTPEEIIDYFTRKKLCGRKRLSRTATL